MVNSECILGVELTEFVDGLNALGKGGKQKSRLTMTLVSRNG